jgi:hypothetical protein
MTCPRCRAESDLTPAQFQCPKCGAKLRESLEEVQIGIAKQQAEHSIGRARLWLLIAAALTLAGGVFLYLILSTQWSMLPDELRLPVYLTVGMGAILLALWAWAKWMPFPATLIALILYGGTTALAVLLDPAGQIGSPLPLLFRTLVIVSLISGVIAAARHRRLARQQAAANATIVR